MCPLYANFPLLFDWGSKLGHNMTSVRIPGNEPLNGIQIFCRCFRMNAWKF
ncbi:unnamed protein product [Penicillium salamii]|uniref:Uncharacterized protein n=1 Tax=Penicillium salamii TaxID=1612424 RepID=A0A9W4JR91_9EURO|nr:unnamed protein product [Penicillium salamii]CAG7965199.1 unnamed protein product [Penicillium salamii]CAG8386192.1 unnamed protein product [Penicillium salamii]CAG8395431.1 unnamed protein product [Penicillium salamii]CAG8414597.1 unnamed protein product [Penicillium salamii]